MIFDATKVTYNKYSCAISGMSRETMKMDDRGSAEYQIWEKRDVNVISEVVKSLNDEKLLQCFFSNVKRRTKNVKCRIGSQVAIFVFFP